MHLLPRERHMATTAVFGIYATRAELEEAIEMLKAEGFRYADISVLLPENLGSGDIGAEKATKAPEGGVTGAASGAVIGGALGWLVGVGTLTITGLGSLIVAGPLVAALARAGGGGGGGGEPRAVLALG